LIVSGIGLSQIIVPLSIAVLGTVPPKDVPAASAFFNLARQVGGSIATAVLVTVLVRSITHHQAALGSDVNLHAQAVQQYLQMHGGEHSVSALRNLADFVTQQAYILSYADTARLTALITAALAPLVVLMRRPQAAGASVPVE
jgi:DHA2 family multidrug resistance protein